METIVIKVAEYYNKPKYYSVMPECIFNALESAFINGEESTAVSKLEFETMINNFNNE